MLILSAHSLPLYGIAEIRSMHAIRRFVAFANGQRNSKDRKSVTHSLDGVALATSRQFHTKKKQKEGEKKNYECH